ncbi:MAG: GFA family protein [Minisyncoccia bacterium]
MKTHTGSCHCGAVTFTVAADIEKVMECNCSHCARKGFLLTFIPKEQFVLLAGEDNLTEYLFNKKHIHHFFCKTCGVQAFGSALGEDGKETVAINVRCLPDVDLATLTIEKFDGKSY